ncbi:MAG: stage II sporulation protein R [Firmicutes bacterium]|nr:stage II sporulation protein R [Bacillota bacterium]MCL5040791.1 stage II sporulation protein R [Bacillota bacterium]
MRKKPLPNSFLLLLFVAPPLILALLTGLVGRHYVYRPGAALAYNPDNLIRLHIIANSDSQQDQEVKLQVRDAVLEYLTPYLKDVSNREEARSIVIAHYRQIEEIAQATLRQAGFQYGTHLEVGRFPFPTRTYGDVTLPAGDYQALRVILGSGTGANWWCVLFPPLCLLDLTGPRESTTEKVVPRVKVEKGEDEVLLAADGITSKEVPVEIRLALFDLWRKNGPLLAQKFRQLGLDRFQVSHLLQLWNHMPVKGGGD